MKIIGTNDNGGFIITAHKDELANLIGYYGYLSIPDVRRSGGRLQVGDEIKVDEMYAQLYRLARLSGEADQAKKCLAAAIELFTVIDPVVMKIIEKEKKVSDES